MTPESQDNSYQFETQKDLVSLCGKSEDFHSVLSKIEFRSVVVDDGGDEIENFILYNHEKRHPGEPGEFLHRCVVSY